MKLKDILVKAVVYQIKHLIWRNEFMEMILHAAAFVKQSLLLTWKVDMLRIETWNVKSFSWISYQVN